MTIGLGIRVGGKPSDTLKPNERGEHPETSRPVKGSAVRGYVVVFEGDDEVGYSSYSPDLPGVVAARPTHSEAEHIALLRQAGQPVPEPAEADSVTILDPAAA